MVVGGRVFHGDGELEARAPAGEGEPRVRADRPARPAGRPPARFDQVEIVEIASGEVALFWDTAPAQTRRLTRALKADLAQLEATEFLRRWRRWELR